MVNSPPDMGHQRAAKSHYSCFLASRMENSGSNTDCTCTWNLFVVHLSEKRAQQTVLSWFEGDTEVVLHWTYSLASAVAVERSPSRLRRICYLWVVVCAATHNPPYREATLRRGTAFCDIMIICRFHSVSIMIRTQDASHDFHRSKFCSKKSDFDSHTKWPE